eukprot:15059505-Alexandrium_andersonii.AAC.1
MSASLVGSEMCIRDSSATDRSRLGSSTDTSITKTQHITTDQGWAPRPVNKFDQPNTTRRVHAFYAAPQ